MAINSPKPSNVAHLLHRRTVTSSHVDSVKISRYGAYIGSQIEVHDSLHRAMDRARVCIDEVIKKNNPIRSGTIILADSMAGAKGRFTRRWFAPLGGVWGCLIYSISLLPNFRQLVPLVLGMACCETVHAFGGDRARIRWVNDVLCGGKKLAGFLVENYTEQKHQEEFFLLGFGINVNNSEFNDEIADIAISLKEVVGKEVDITSFTENFIAQLAWNIGLLHYSEELALKQFDKKQQKLCPLLQRWIQLTDSIGQDIVFGFDVLSAPEYYAKVAGINSGGGLVLCLQDGTCKTEYSGEIRYID